PDNDVTINSIRGGPETRCSYTSRGSSPPRLRSRRGGGESLEQEFGHPRVGPRQLLLRRRPGLRLGPRSPPGRADGGGAHRRCPRGSRRLLGETHAELVGQIEPPRARRLAAGSRRARLGLPPASSLGSVGSLDI